MPEEARSGLEALKDWASPVVALIVGLIAAWRGVFSNIWHGGVSLGQMQSTQSQHGREIEDLKIVIARIQADTRGLATKEDIKELASEVNELSRRLFDVLKAWSGPHAPG